MQTFRQTLKHHNKGRSKTKTNNSTSQGKHKQQRHPNLQQFPLLKLAHTTVRQADRQTDRQIKNQAPITAKHYSRGCYDLSRDAQPGYKKNWGTLKVAITPESLPLP